MFQLDQLSSEIERAALRWYMAELRYGKICKLPKLGKELFMLCAKRHINRRTSLVSSKEPAPSKESGLPMNESDLKKLRIWLHEQKVTIVYRNEINNTFAQALVAIELEKSIKGLIASTSAYIERFECENAQLKQRLKLAENLRGRTRIEGEDVGVPHLRED